MTAEAWSTDNAKKYCFVLFFYLFFNVCHFSRAQAQPITGKTQPRQHPIERLLRDAHADITQTELLSTYLVQHSSLPEFRTDMARPIIQALTSAEIATKRHKTAYIHEIELINAYKDWCLASNITVSADAISVTSLHRYREFMAHFIPSLSMRDVNGSVSTYITPVESFYLLNTLVSHGSIPAIQIHGAVGSLAKSQQVPASTFLPKTQPMTSSTSTELQSTQLKDIPSSISSDRLKNASILLSQLGIVI